MTFGYDNRHDMLRLRCHDRNADLIVLGHHAVRIRHQDAAPVVAIAGSDLRDVVVELPSDEVGLAELGDLRCLVDCFRPNLDRG